LRLLRRPTPIAQRKNADDPHAGSLHEGQHIAGRNAVARLQAMLAVQAQMAVRHNLGRRIAAAKEAGLKQIFVQAQLGRRGDFSLSGRPNFV